MNTLLALGITNMNPLLTLADWHTWGIGEIAIFIVVVAAVVALVYVALRQFGVAIPGWVIQCFWICVVAFVVILAIKFVLSL